MTKLAVGLLVLISLMTTTNQLSCYIGEQEIARLQDGFDSCVSNMNVMTYEVYYEGVVSSFKSYNSTGTAGIGRQNSCAAQMIAGNFTEIKCYCYYDSCNKLLNLHEFAGELNATLERFKKFYPNEVIKMSNRPNKPKKNEKINKVKLGVASDMDGVIRNTEQYLGEFSADLESQLDAVEKENKALKEELKKQKDENEKMKANTRAANKLFSQRLATTNETHQAAIKLLEDELMACKLENEKLKSGNGAGNEKGTTMTAYGNIESNVEPFQKVSGENVEVGRPKFQMTFNSKAKLQTSEEPDTWLKTTLSTTSTAFPSTTQEMPKKEDERSHMSNSNIIRGRISWHEAISQSQKFAVNQATLRKMNLISCFFDSNKEFQFLPQKVDELPRDSMEFAKLYGKDKSGNSVSEEARNMYHTLLEEQDRQIRLGMIKIKRD